MKLRQTKHCVEGISAASMADIAFLLIIFFMVTTAFSVKKGIDFQLPQDEKEETIEQEKAILVEIEADGQMLLNKNRIALNELPQQIGQKLALNPEKFVIVTADDETAYERLIDVLDELKQIEVKNIAIPTKRERMNWSLAESFD